MSRGPLLHVLIGVLVLDLLCLGGLPSDAFALVAPALTPAHETSAARSDDLSKVQVVLENKIVQQRLKDYGFTPEEIRVRLAELSDEDMHQLATNIDGLMVGGHFVVGFLVAFVVVLLVIALIYISGHKINVT